jgi:hypothetical protein
MKANPERNDARTRIVFSACLLLGISIGLAIADGAAHGPQQGPAQSSPPQQTEAIQAPPVAVSPSGAVAPTTPGVLFYRSVPPSDPLDKGSTCTDMGAGFPAGPPTENERAKLEMSRAAVEAARAAGTLFISPIVAAHADPSAEAAQAKLDALSATRPAQLPPDPAAGIGVPTPPVQLVGPPELTPAEIQKLADEVRNGGSR